MLEHTKPIQNSPQDELISERIPNTRALLKIAAEGGTLHLKADFCSLILKI